MMKKRYVISAFTLLGFGLILLFNPLAAHAAGNNNLIDDGVFDNTNAISAAAIDSWLNGFPSSCISPNSGFTAPDPTGYSPDANFVDGHYAYGSPVSAGRVIYDAAVAHGVNPQVLITKLQNEEGLVEGNGPYGCGATAMASAVGYACTDGGSFSHSYTYTGADPYTNSNALVTPLYYRNGVAQNSISGSCVNQNVKAGFSQQVVHAAWLLSFSRHKSKGETSWAVVHDSWNHCEDNNTCAANLNIPASWSCYSGYMTQGSYKRCPYDSQPVFYDGFATICDGNGANCASVHMDTGATAALYVYTPHFQSFTSIFTNYFGAPYDVFTWSVVSQYSYTDQTKSTSIDSTKLIPGQRIYVGFKAKNTGDTTWTNSGSNPIRAATTGPRDRNSTFCDNSWLSCNRPAAMQEASVAPGGTGTFEFWYKYGGAGTYQEHFSLVAEGLKWMNDPGLYFYTVAEPPIYSWSIAGQNSFTDATKTAYADSSNLAVGQRVYLEILAKNTGNVIWSNTGANPVHLGTINPIDRSSTFCDNTWLGCNRPAGMAEASVPPGGTATFDFWYTPSRTGIFREFFKPVAEGAAWMNDTGLNYYTAVHFDTSGTTSTLNSGQGLNPGDLIMSSDGRYKLVMQDDGNLVIYSINRPLWASNTAGKPVVKAVMQSDGNLVLYDAQGKPYWASGTAGRGSSRLVMQSDGNLVIYNSSNRPTWATGTQGRL